MFLWLSPTYSLDMKALQLRLDRSEHDLFDKEKRVQIQHHSEMEITYIFAFFRICWLQCLLPFKKAIYKGTRILTYFMKVIAASAHEAMISYDQRLSHQIHVIQLIYRTFSCKCDYSEVLQKALVMGNGEI